MFGSAEVSEEHSTENKQRLFISELAVTVESASSACVWSTLGQAGEWESFIVKWMEGFKNAVIAVVAMGKLEMN